MINERDGGEDGDVQKTSRRAMRVDNRGRVAKGSGQSWGNRGGSSVGK